ncbi:unnamed protein product [Dicrocoelium dendriticum]|nr:unnamed protein product [Dicrocoelium dendriticum]
MAVTHSDRLNDLEERMFFSNGSVDDSDRVRASQSIDLFVFAIFLYIQQINKISLRASAVSANAEWPGSHNRSSELDSGRSTPIRPCRNLDEQYHLQFVTENLAELLDLLVEPEGYSQSGLDASLSEEAIDALNLILEGTIDQGRSLSSFSELVRAPSIQPSTGYIKTSHTYHLRGLQSWIRSWLASNPFSVENCIKNGRRLQWRLPYQPPPDSTLAPGTGTSQQQQQQSDASKRQKIATNAHQVPRIGGRSGNKLVIMSMISRQIIARSSATLDGSTLKIHRAHCSYLYLLSPMRSVTLDKCRKLTIVLGPIENTLQLNHCEDCLIVSACRRAVLVACRRCTLHLSIQSQPILIQPPVPTANPTAGSTGGGGGSSTPTPGNSGNTTAPSGAATVLGNEEILLAPFHTTYLRLPDHLLRANLSTKVNYWDRPFLLGQDSNRTDSGTQLPGRGRCWELLRPAHFYPFNIPLLLPAKLENVDTTDNHLADGSPRPCSSALDLSAALVTDTCQYFTESDFDFDGYVKAVSKRLVIPIPEPYLMALKERATVYHKWPQHIAKTRLTSEQRQTFGTLVDQRFRQWLSESGNLRQLQLLELSTSHCALPQPGNIIDQSAETGTIPPTGFPNTAPGQKVTRPNSATIKASGVVGRNDRTRSGLACDNRVLNGTCTS